MALISLKHVLILLSLINLKIAGGNDTSLEEKAVKQYPPFGRPMRSEFTMGENFILFDHGAYGHYPKAVMSALHTYQAKAEANIDLWIKRDARIELTKVREALAEVVKASADDIVMIPNTTSGMNAIFRSMVFGLGERILQFSTIYNSMGSLIQYIVDYSEGSVSSLTFNVTYPISNDKLVEDFEAFLNATDDPERPIRIALIDHISSSPAVILPIERLIPLLKARNILVLIDGAHAIGQIPLNLTQLAPDYYLTNCHKWLYAARSCSMMYVDKKHQGTIHPARINSGYKQPADFQNEFFWTGTIDYTPYLTAIDALKFRSDVGGEEAIMKYNHDLAVEGGRYLAAQWNTSVMQDEDQMGNMVDVRLPLDYPNADDLHSDFFMNTLLDEYPNIYCSTYKHGGVWYARLSVQIYIDMDDFKVVESTFKEICDRVNARHLSSKAVELYAITFYSLICTGISFLVMNHYIY